MKRLIVLAFLSVFVFSCKTDKKETSKKAVVAYNSFGEKISDKDAFSAEEMHKKYKDLKKGDTVTVKFASSIKDVCSKKGCWMKLGLDNSEETMVRFKDYGFFMPLDSKGKEVIVEGKAFIKEVPVDELKHYAEDAGKSKEEIDKITEPKVEFAFEATGVLMKK